MQAARAAQALAQALAQASSSLTRPHDVAGALTDLMANCRLGLDVDAVGILVESSGRLELLASSSHDASELEVHQLHTDEGPCIDAHQDGETIQLHTADKLLQRWPTFAPTMIDAGFGSVHATPLTWQGQIFGAMGLFRRSDDEFGPDEDAVARAFADIATVLVVHLEDVDSQQVERRISEALASRIVVEQAKGVLADQRGLSMAQAFDELVEGARERQLPLTGWAAQVIESAQQPRRV